MKILLMFDFAQVGEGCARLISILLGFGVLFVLIHLQPFSLLVGVFLGCFRGVVLPRGSETTVKETDYYKRTEIDGNLSVSHRHMVRSHLPPQLFDGDLNCTALKESASEDQPGFLLLVSECCTSTL